MISTPFVGPLCYSPPALPSLCWVYLCPMGCYVVFVYLCECLVAPQERHSLILSSIVRAPQGLNFSCALGFVYVIVVLYGCSHLLLLVNVFVSFLVVSLLLGCVG